MADAMDQRRLLSLSTIRPGKEGLPTLTAHPSRHVVKYHHPVMPGLDMAHQGMRHDHDGTPDTRGSCLLPPFEIDPLYRIRIVDRHNDTLVIRLHV